MNNGVYKPTSLSLAGAATSIILVATKVLSRQTRVLSRQNTSFLSRQKYAFRDKTFVATKVFVKHVCVCVCVCRDKFCRDKHTSAARKHVFCRDKHVFVATKLLSRQK